MASDHIAYLRPFLRGLKSGLPAAIVLHHHRCAFRVVLIERCIIRIQDPDGRIPVVWMIEYWINERFILQDKPSFFILVIQRLDVLSEVLPECISLTGLD